MIAPNHRRFVYVRAQVAPPDPSRALLWQGLTEQATGHPVPDVIPHADPGGISFEHAFVCAEDEDDAYLLGHDALPPVTPGRVTNDYVIELVD